MDRFQAIKILNRLYEGVMIFFFISIAFSFRIVASVAMITMLVFSLAHYRLDQGKWWNGQFFNFFNLGCYLYFIIQGIALFYTKNVHYGLFVQQIDLGLIAIPVAVFYCRVVRRENYGRMMVWYILILLAASLFALGYAFHMYLLTQQLTYFFYHPLVRIYSNHAIQYSIFIFIALLFLIEEYRNRGNLKNRKWILFLLIYFTVFLFLLTSKLVIAIYLMYIVYLVIFTDEFFRRKAYRWVALASMGLALVIVLSTDTLLRRRISEEIGNNISFIRQSEFSPSDYFNGIEFRLVSWRNTYELLNENNGWLWGVSPGDAQDLLNDKYRKLNMFTGGLPDNRKGYLNYHTHNQFLQALLESGILGLAAFILLCAGMITLAKKSGDRSLIVLTILLICYCFADAVLKTQYGIIIFIFFPLFLYKGRGKDQSTG